jgi:hypothetical protein
MTRNTNIIRLIATTALATTFVWAAARSANGATGATDSAIDGPATQPWVTILPPLPSQVPVAQPVNVPEPPTVGAFALAACAFLARRGRRDDRTCNRTQPN